MRAPLAASALGVALLAACAPPPQFALTVRDPDKLCRLITFSRCERPPDDTDLSLLDVDAGEPP
jgi:hypothetical protein